MTNRHLRHLPVVEQDKLLGLISIGDLVKAAMDDQKKLIEQLQQYISG
jgi:CBS domain-containing protein